MENTEQTTIDTKAKLMRILKLVGRVLVYIIFALCLCLLIFSIASKRSDDGAISIFGREMRVVVSGSMEKNPNTDVSEYKIKSIPIKSMVFIQKVPKDEAAAEAWYSALQVGDVLTFRYLEAGRQITITHRIIDIEEKPTGGYIISLRADNGEGSSLGWETQVIDTSDVGSPNYVIGKVTRQDKVFGNIVYFLNQPLGLVLIIIVPSALMIMTECVRLGSAFSKMKEEKKQEQEEKEEGKS